MGAPAVVVWIPYMMKVLVALCALLALVVLAHAGEVVVLTEENFRENVDSGKWLAPIWEYLAAADPGANIGKVDCTEQKNLCSQYGVRGYPTVNFFNDGGEPEKYSGARTVAAFKEFLASH